MKNLFSNIRFYVLLTSAVFSLLVYLYITITIPLEQLQIIRLTQIYALTSLTFLYLALLAGPFCYTFKALPFRGHYLKARRAIGVSAFYFGLLHACFAFFGQLGGFEGLGFLSSKYLLAIVLSFTALIILFLMAATSFDFMVAKLSFPKWKILHRFVYLAGIFILIHALMLGTHFQDLFGYVPQLVFAGLAFLLFLEGMRIDDWIQKQFGTLPKFNYASVVVLGVILTGLLYFFLPIPSESGISFGIHSQHIQLAKQAQQGTTGTGTANNNLPKIPGLQGDRTKRYTVSFNNPSNVQPNQDTELTFKVNDASSGNKVSLFNKLNDKIAHLIIVDNELKSFTHIHPEQKENGFTISHQFPKAGRHHLYIDFQPFGAIEQQMAFTLDVGEVSEPAKSDAQPDTQLTKIFEDYEVTLEYPRPLKASQLSVGQQLLTYTIKDAQTKNPITTLKPYLAAFGHVVMINKDTFDYLHVHPNDLRAPLPDQNGGPKVAFMPLGLYGPIKPGIYRVFAQFNPDNKLFTNDFTVEIK